MPVYIFFLGTLSHQDDGDVDEESLHLGIVGIVPGAGWPVWRKADNGAILSLHSTPLRSKPETQNPKSEKYRSHWNKNLATPNKHKAITSQQFKMQKWKPESYSGHNRPNKYRDIEL